MNTVEFPGLWGLKLTISQVALKLGTISIYWYGIIIAAAFMTAVLLAMKHSEKFGIEQENIIDMVLIAAPAGIIGARLYYVIFSWGDYRDDWTEIFKIWHGGLAIYGGIIGGVLAVYFFARAKKIQPLKLMDYAVPYIAIAQAIGRWGNFVNQEAFGTNTTLPWGMTSETVKNFLYELQMKGMDVNPDIPVHPTFLYESIWNIFVFIILIKYRNRVLSNGQKARGQVISFYMVLYGLGRFFIEGLRTDSLMLGSLRISQVLAALFVIIFSITLFRARKKAENAEEQVELGTSEYGAVLMNMKDEEDRQKAVEVENVEEDPNGEKMEDHKPDEQVEQPIQQEKENASIENDNKQ